MSEARWGRVAKEVHVISNEGVFEGAQKIFSRLEEKPSERVPLTKGIFYFLFVLEKQYRLSNVKLAAFPRKVRGSEWRRLEENVSSINFLFSLRPFRPSFLGFHKILALYSIFHDDRR